MGNENRYAVAIHAMQQLKVNLTYRVKLFFLKAATQDEALGKAHRIADRMFPRQAGWESIDILISDVESPMVDLESIEVSE